MMSACCNAATNSSARSTSPSAAACFGKTGFGENKPHPLKQRQASTRAAQLDFTWIAKLFSNAQDKLTFNHRCTVHASFDFKLNKIVHLRQLFGMQNDAFCRSHRAEKFHCPNGRK